MSWDRTSTPGRALIGVKAAILGVALFGCSASGDGGSSYGSGSGASGGMIGTGGSGVGGSGIGGSGIGGSGVGGSGGALPTDCSEATTYIYVVGVFNELVRFDPKQNKFDTIGTLACPGTGIGATPFSMAVQRNGTAWVLFSDGRLFHANITDASCQATSFAANQAGFSTFGMAFVSDQAGSAAESLYVAQGTAQGTGNVLGRIDAGSLQLQPIGPYDQLASAAELTGTGNGDLFGFFRTQPITVAHINKGNAAILAKGSPALGPTMVAWAFAFWGGDFYLFSAQSLGGSRLDRYNLSSGQTQTISQNIGFTAVGAGVSTCAPVTIPR